MTECCLEIRNLLRAAIQDDAKIAIAICHWISCCVKVHAGGAAASAANNENLGNVVIFAIKRIDRIKFNAKHALRATIAVAAWGAGAK